MPSQKPGETGAADSRTFGEPLPETKPGGAETTGRLVADARFQMLVEQARTPIVLSRGLEPLYVNPACVELLGYGSAGEMLALPLAAFFPADELALAFERSRRRAEGLEPMRPYETTFLRADGSRVPLRCDPAPIDLPDGRALAFFLTDLREQKEVEAALRASEARYRELIEQASDAIFVADEAGRLLEANPAACELLGYSRDELLALPRVADLVAQMPQGDESLLARITAGERVIDEVVLVRRDGSRVYAEVSARQLPDGRIQGILRDITARKASDEERDRLVAAVAQASDSIVMTDSDGRTVYVNPAFTAITGYSPAEILGRRPPEVLRSPGQLPEVYAGIDGASAGGLAWSGRVINRRTDGTLVELDLAISPLRDNAGRYVGSVEVGRDVSREVALESQLRQAMKMEAIGRLAGGIAHDFNNQLTAIAGFGGLLSAALPAGSPEAADVAEILRAADRAAALTRQLLAFSRKQVLQPRALDLDEVVRGVAPMIERLIGEDVTLTLRSNDAACVLADPGQIEQVIVNLAVNARDAMPDGGTLTIETSNLELHGRVAERLGAAPGRYVMLTASDTGCGMTRDVLDHVFEPFFTTKEHGRGTGLGLSTVFGIVKQSNGFVTAESEPNRGATFRIYLPAALGAASAGERAPTQPLAPRGAETILVAEDEAAVREFACRVLRKHGYRVISASSGFDAIGVAARHPGRIDLLFTDVVMPGISGPEAARQLVAMRPDIRVLCTSGYSEEASMRTDVFDAGIAYLAKPYRADELLRRTRAVLDAIGDEA